MTIYLNPEEIIFHVSSLPARNACCVADIKIPFGDPRLESIRNNDFRIVVSNPRNRYRIEWGTFILERCQWVGWGYADQNPQRIQINYWDCTILSRSETRDCLIEVLSS